jgi:hypothetical protein
MERLLELAEIPPAELAWSASPAEVAIAWDRVFAQARSQVLMSGHAGGFVAVRRPVAMAWEQAVAETRSRVLTSELPGGVVETRLVPLSAEEIRQRDWVCYCSPSRSVFLAHQARVEALNRRARRARRRARIAAAVSVLALIASLFFMLV